MLEALLALTLLLLLAAGAAVVWLFQSRATLRAAATTAQAEAARLRTERDEDLAKAGAIADQLRADLSAAEIEAARLAERERAAAEERDRTQRWIAEQKNELANLFAKLSSDTLDASGKRLLGLMNERFAAEQKQASAELDKRREAVETLVKPLGETLDKTRERLDKLDKQVELAATETAKLGQSTSKLVQAFSRPEIRGRYGEIQLRRVAELAGMLPYCDFDEQSTTRTAEGAALRPDMVVKLPNERVIAIDAKCNIDSYIRAIETINADEREDLLKKFAAAVADQAAKLSKKSYWAQYDTSPEFVVMFIPGDQFLDAALERRPDLLEYAAENRVIMASPATLIGLLRAVHVGWREQTLAAQARDLFDLGKQLHERAAVAFDHLAELGKLLERTTKKYNDAVGSIETRLTPTLRKFEEAGAKSQRDLPEPPEVTVVPRSMEHTTTNKLFAEPAPTREPPSP